MSKPKKEIKLIYIPFKCVVTTVPHYDLCYYEGKDCFNIACIVTDKSGAKLIRKWIKEENSKNENI